MPTTTAPTILSVATILECAKLAGGYAIIDRAKKRSLYGGFVSDWLPEKIFFVWKRVQNRYDKDPTDETLRDTANFLWDLIGKYGLKAQLALGQGGGSVIIVGNGQLPLIPFRIPFFINSADFPSGSTSLTLNFRSFGTESSDIEVDLQNVVVNPLLPETIGDFTYAVTFNSSTTVITFQQDSTPTAPFDDQIMIISGFKYQ